MRVRVRFRYRADTGEVEVFRVEDIVDGPRAANHNARHDAVTRDVARVVDPYPRITEEIPDGAGAGQDGAVVSTRDDERTGPVEQERLRPA